MPVMMKMNRGLMHKALSAKITKLSDFDQLACHWLNSQNFVILAEVLRELG